MQVDVTPVADVASRLWSPAANLAGAGAAALLGHFWRRFRQRMVELRCQIVHTPATNSAGLGAEVEIKYGGIAAPNLHLCSVTVENASSQDLQNVALNMSYREGTIFLSGGGAMEASGQAIPLTEQYLARFSALEASPQDAPGHAGEQAWIFSHRDYLVPVFNRGARVQFAFTVHGIQGRVPELTVTCDHLGVRLVLQPVRQLFWGEPNTYAALVGFTAGVVLLFVLPSFVGQSWTVSWAMFLFGSLTIVIGALLLKLWRGAVKLLS